jgi:hypothetical protein
VLFYITAKALPDARPDTAEARLREGIEVRLQNGTIDEVVARCCNLHIEQLSNQDWSVGITATNGDSAMFNIGAKNNRTHVVMTEIEHLMAAENAALSPPSGGDEAKESEGGVEGHAPKRREPENADVRDRAGIKPGPSEPSPPADRREIVAQALSFLRDVARNRETWTPEAERVYQNAQKTVAALDGGR